MATTSDIKSKGNDKYPNDTKQQPLYGDLESEAGAAAGPSSSREPLLLLGPLTTDGPLAASSSSFSSSSKLPPPGPDELPSYDSIIVPSYPSEPPSFSHYTPKTHTITNGKVVSHDSHLNTDTEALFQWLQSHTAHPPSPLLKVEGTHSSYRTITRDGKTETESTTVTDFSMTFSLAHLMAVTDPGKLQLAAPDVRRHRGTRRARTANPTSVEDALTSRDWCAAYIHARTICKEFKLRKVVLDIPEDYIRGHIEAAIRATNYQGRLTVTFPVQDRSVVLAPNNWIAHARYGPWRWFFYLTFLWLLTWPILWMLTRKWEVIDAVWEANDVAAREWVQLYARTVGVLAKGRRQGAVRYAELEAVREATQARERGDFDGTGPAGVGTWVGGFLAGMREVQESLAGGWGGDDGFLARNFVGGRTGSNRSRWNVGVGGWQVGHF